MRGVALFVLWVALVDTRDPVQLLAGAIVALLCAGLAGLVGPWGPRWSTVNALEVVRLGPARLAGPIIRLVREMPIVTRALWLRVTRRRAVRGRFRLAPYRPGPARRSAAGHALTESLGSMPPNRYVVGVDPEGRTLLVHELMPSDEPIDPFAGR